MSLAKTPLPVPISPRNSTGESTAAHCSALSRTACIATLFTTTGAPSGSVFSARRISAQVDFASPSGPCTRFTSCFTLVPDELERGAVGPQNEAAGGEQHESLGRAIDHGFEQFRIAREPTPGRPGLFWSFEAVQLSRNVQQLSHLKRLTIRTRRANRVEICRRPRSGTSRCGRRTRLSSVPMFSGKSQAPE